MSGEPHLAADAVLLAAYHRLYELYWEHTATVDIGVEGYNGISYVETIALDEAAEAIEVLLVSGHKAGPGAPRSR